MEGKTTDGEGVKVLYDKDMRGGGWMGGVKRNERNQDGRRTAAAPVKKPLRVRLSSEPPLSKPELWT